MTTEAKQRANEMFIQWNGYPRFTKSDIKRSLNGIETRIIKELRFPKDLRDITYLNLHFKERAYYKALLSKFN
jgi:hypothetical protein